MISSNAPNGYECPICLGIEGIARSETLIVPSDIVYRDEYVTALVNSFFVGKNLGHVIVVPNVHYENIYDLPSDYGHHIFDVAQTVATIMKEAYQCDGITIRQNNEPAGDQHAFHFHLHIFPRYNDDGYNLQIPSDKHLAHPEERAIYAKKIKNALDMLNH